MMINIRGAMLRCGWQVPSLVLAGALLLAGCSTGPEPEQEGIRVASMDAPPDDITGAWRVTGAIDPQGRSLRPDAAPFTVEIDGEGNVAGQAACNNWNASVEHVDEEHLRFGAIGLTTEQCNIQDSDSQTFERDFINNLTRTMEWTRSSDTLVLRFQDGQEWELTRPE